MHRIAALLALLAAVVGVTGAQSPPAPGVEATPAAPSVTASPPAALGTDAAVVSAADEPAFTPPPWARRPGLRAGAAVVDSTWHVGASAGQYASDGTPLHDTGHGQGLDPSLHTVRRAPSYGVQSRESVRALLIEGGDGTRAAVVANNLYIPQDLLATRVAQLLVAHDRHVDDGGGHGAGTGIDEDNLVVAAGHSHTTPYYSTPSWGVWLFQDVFDLRYFEFMARRMADAVIAAAADLRPARVGGATSPFGALKRHSFGPTVADDGTPAGYPETDNDNTVEVLAFDDVSEPDAPRPIATWVVHGLHPEMLEGNDLLSGEWINAMETIVDREVGGVTLLTQNDTGTSEPARDARAHPPAARAEYSHRDYAQMTRAARLLATAVTTTRSDIAAGQPALPDQWAPFTTDADVRVASVRFAPPSARLSPTVSNCRLEQLFELNPPVPVLGLPDCEFPIEMLSDAGIPAGDLTADLPVDLRVTYDALRRAGVPIPDNIGVPSLAALEETAQVHLMALRIGTIGVTVCPCEQWADQSRNIQSRLDHAEGNLWLGFDWSVQTTPDGRPWCVPGSAAGTVVCADPRRRGTTDLDPVPQAAFDRMVAQVRNDAAGWDALDQSLGAEADPLEVAAIQGNYTHEELAPWGYDMVVTVGMANDYWGYIATYREFQRGDHYRKALSGLGPHGSDFLATRLSRMAAGLNGWPGADDPAELLTPKDLLFVPDRARQRLTALAIGTAAATGVPLYERMLPADGGRAAIRIQPGDVTRFGATTTSWTGGSNWFDQPAVRVERQDPDTGGWAPFGDQSLGEVQTRLHYPLLSELVGYLTGDFAWRWEASFEAFDSDIVLPDASGVARSQTPAGTYRFVIDGTRHRGGGGREPYHLESEPFDVRPWDGIAVDDVRVEADGSVSFAVAPIDYPDTYESGFPFIDGVRTVAEYGPGPGDDELFCYRCSFRPWADTGSVASAALTVRRAGGGAIVVEAALDDDGRWRTPPGSAATADEVLVDAGGVVDSFGERNPTASLARP